MDYFSYYWHRCKEGVVHNTLLKNISCHNITPDMANDILILPYLTTLPSSVQYIRDFTGFHLPGGTMTWDVIKLQNATVVKLLDVWETILDHDNKPREEKDMPTKENESNEMMVTGINGIQVREVHCLFCNLPLKQTKVDIDADCSSLGYTCIHCGAVANFNKLPTGKILQANVTILKSSGGMLHR
jgi:hypothetical protein